MKLLRSVGAQLSLALVLVVAIALIVVYVIVVPRLERNLTDAKLDALTRSAASELRFVPEISIADPLFPIGVEEFVDNAAAATNARVVLLRPLASSQLSVIEDSLETRSAPSISGDRVAVAAALSLALERDIVTHDGERYAEVAYPVPAFPSVHVLLFSAKLDDTLANVELVKQRVLLAGGIALLIALLLGFGGAAVFARRIRRLERAADRIAGGDLDEPVVDRGSDELGQLAAAFERMRGRLAHFEEARREFVANASHELRTPIFSLGGFLELLDDEELDDETRREFLQTMRGQVARLTKLTADLLDLSRLDAGRLRIDLEPVDLGGVAEALITEFAPFAGAGDHEFGVVADVLPPTALADEQRVLQIGRILVENALVHTAPGTPVRIRLDADDARALLRVEDEGAGIPQEHAADVFERFFRLDGGLASGSGLGLAIARDLAEAMGGTLELESRPGRTIFSLGLPGAPASAEADFAPMPGSMISRETV
jgi:signal transduction histidine kinase